MRALLPLADVITPNLAELAVLVDEQPVTDLTAAIDQGRRLAARTGARVLVKGGHLPGPTTDANSVDGSGTSTDALVDPDGSHVLLPGPWIRTNNTHGTGCSLSSALAALRPQRDSWAAAAADAKAWLSGALAASDQLDVGSGAGPVHHFHHLWPAADDVLCANVGADRADPRSHRNDALHPGAGRRQPAVAELPVLPGAGRPLPPGVRPLPGQGRGPCARPGCAGILRESLRRSPDCRNVAAPIAAQRTRRNPCRS